MIKIFDKEYKFDGAIIYGYRGGDISLERLLKFSPMLVDYITIDNNGN